MCKSRILIILIVVGLSLGVATVALAGADYSRRAVSPGGELNAPFKEPARSQAGSGVRIDVNYAHDWVEAFTSSGEFVTVTITGDAGVYTNVGQADGSGFFGTYNWDWNPEQPNIAPGDLVTAAVRGTVTAVNPIGTIDGELDFNADTVSGTIKAPWFSSSTLTVRCEVWEEGGPGIDVTGVNPDGGSYFCDFSNEGWDLQPDQMVAVRYLEPDGDTVINIIEPPWMRVNYGHDEVEGNFPAGHTLWITVTDSLGALKATTEVETFSGGGWGGDGFGTYLTQWSPSDPDIVPGDWVYFQADDGYTNTMRVGEISGTVDVGSDSVSGPIYASWFTETLEVECHPWGAPGPAPGKSSTAEPDGSDPYTCQWDPLTEWDVQPGQDVAVMYIEPDDIDRVINVFREPAPDVSVGKWAEGSGQAVPGGPVIFNINVSNDSDAAATTITLTDTLPVSTTYLTDTSGVTPGFGTGWITWTLGPLDPGEWLQFQLVLTNSANPGDGLHNEVDVSAQYDFNFDNNHAEADVNVTDEPPDLYVNKDPNPGDPAPGETMLWYINYGNNGSAASGPVVLTDTIPLSTSVVSWYSENGYELWTDVSVAGEQLVLEAPTIPGNWGDRILLRLLISDSVPVGTQLTNTVAITTAGDTNPGDNFDLRDDVWVNEPRWDGGIDKNFGWGTLTPGGEVGYNINVYNGGNLATHLWLTDTLPAGTSFIDSWQWTGQYDVPYLPDYVDSEIAVWDVGVLEPGEWLNLNLQLAISDAVVSGTVLTNCAEIAIDGDDSWLYNDSECVVETVTDPGSNLRVRKEYWWNWEGTLSFQINFENIGTTTLLSATLTDTLPVSTSFNGNWWHWYWEDVQLTDLGDELVWTISRLDPGNSAGLGFEVDLDAGIVGVPGLAFTNTVSAPIPGDVNPADNDDEVTAVTGPDIYVDKWLSGGVPRPGSVVTFTVEFGNRNGGPWHANGPTTLTDTLPAEMTFITATGYLNPDITWTPNILPGNVLEWGWGGVCPECWWRFNMVVQITDTMGAWDVLTNTIEMFSQDPNDLEWDYSNNIATTDVVVLHPEFAVSKDYTGNAVAGTPVTFTLALTNTGNWDDTGLLVSDLLPDYVTYTTGGDYDPGTGVISWTVDALAAGETNEVEFGGVLACTAGVTVLNDTYQVTGSDEGVSSPSGPPVSFDILTPTLVTAFDQSTTTILASESVAFTSTSTTNGTPIVSWEWDFGDDTTTTGANATHVYTESGVYTVTLTITDACGFADTLTKTEAVTVLSYETYLPIIER